MLKISFFVLPVVLIILIILISLKIIVSWRKIRKLISIIWRILLLIIWIRLSSKPIIRWKRSLIIRWIKLHHLGIMHRIHTLKILIILIWIFTFIIVSCSWSLLNSTIVKRAFSSVFVSYEIVSMLSINLRFFLR